MKVPWWLGLGTACLAVAFVTTAWSFDHPGPPTQSSGYHFTVQNSADQSVRFSLLVSGETICSQELGHGILDDVTSCDSKAKWDGQRHPMLVRVEWANGARKDISGFVKAQDVFLQITDFSVNSDDPDAKG